MSENLKAFIGKNGGLVRLVAAFLFGLAIILFAGGFFAPSEPLPSEQNELSELSVEDNSVSFDIKGFEIVTLKAE